MDGRVTRTTICALMAWIVAGAAVSQTHTSTTAPDPAILFGAQAAISGAELSPDGKRVAYIGPGPGNSNAVFVVDIEAGKVTPVAKADGKPLRLTRCGWSAADRLICREYGLVREATMMVPYTRMVALDADGNNMLPLGRRDSSYQLYGRQFDGQIIDWLDGADGKVLMTRYYVPEMSTGRRTAQTEEGYGVDLLDTRNERATSIERPRLNTEYMSDGRGVVRLMSRHQQSAEQLTGEVMHFYRASADQPWQELGTDDHTDSGIQPLAVDSGVNAAYVLKYLDGRRALYRIALDGSLKTELVFAHPQVDVEDVVTIGRSGRVIGASYSTDKPHVEYFDPAYKQLAAALGRAMPVLPLISFVSASADEQVLLIFASSDNHPGRYYVFNRKTRHLDELMPVRPALEKIQLAQMKPVSYRAADGTLVPAYLTLPPGVDKPEGLPAIVMPHGGPASRDVWGFDWHVQYFANRGFIVLQPNFRGSAGFGDEWLVRNGFKSWNVAIGDINDGARWLVAQGMANPDKLAIVGWSYGGYAALQSNVVAPDLFKAVIATAPVADLQMLKNESEGFTNERLSRDYIGSGPHIEAGSPARHPGQFKAPVLLFHGDIDANVYVSQSRAMDKALRGAGKHSELIVYPGLDHQLYDNAARVDMLRRCHEFLRTHLKL